jgi:carbamoyltransferase
VIVLGYSGLDDSVRFAQLDPLLVDGEERIVQGLDSAAAIIVDGEIVAAAAEERFCGEKHTGRFPVASIRYCLEAAGIACGDIDLVAHGFDYRRYANIFRVTNPDIYHAVYDPDRQRQLWREHFAIALGEKFVPVKHHLAHAASTYFPSGYKNALCLVADGMGETESMTVYDVRDGDFQVLARHPIADSLGMLYGLVTYHLGFKFNADEYKVMGLAPYGDPAVFREFFDAVVALESPADFHIRSMSNHREMLKRLAAQIASPDSVEMLPQQHCDFAAAAQEALEKVLFHVIGHWQRQTRRRDLCMAGGVALNCTFNGKLAAKRLFERIHIQPAAGDDGTALGAALITARQRGDKLSPSLVDAMPFYGPEFSSEAIEAAIIERADGLEIVEFGSGEAAADDAARALADKRIVAWFQGREYGPRALGNRSILANPLIPGIKDKLNRIIKLREGFRPFAPAVAREFADQYFEFLPSTMFDYMLAVCPVTPEWRGRLPGITHVDGSARMQTIGDRQNPLFHRLIMSFGRISGVYCLVNTSFNLQGQPIIVSPTIAIDTFRKVAFDRLYLGTFRLSKGKK